MYALEATGQIRRIAKGCRPNSNEIGLSDQEQSRLESLSVAERKSIYAHSRNLRTFGAGGKLVKAAYRYVMLRSALRATDRPLTVG